jgi:curved DNA-binding protein CbpA
MSKLSDETIDELVGKIYKGAKKSSKTERKHTEVNIDEVDFEKLKGDDRKAHVDLFSGMIDVYGLIGVKEDDPQDYVKKKCNEKLAKYHPSKMNAMLVKVPASEREEEREKLMEQYNLIKQAYNILRDPEKREYYDLQKKTMESKNFVKQKSSFEEYIKLQESEINETSRKNAENAFKIGFLDMDKKHGFKRNELDDEPLTTEDFNKKMQDMELSRKALDDELSTKQRNMFEGRTFNPVEFNKAWEKKKRHDEKRKGKGNSDTSLTLWDGLTASNDFGVGGTSDYVGLDSDYGDLYSKNNYNTSQYASILDDISENGDNMSVNSDDIDVSYVTGHNKDNSDVNKRFDEYMKARERDDEYYNAREFGDTNAWRSVYDNPMNISSSMGTMVGKEVKTLDTRNKKNNSINKSTIDAYKQLMLEREKDFK